MKTTLLSTLLLFGLAAPASAQTPADAPPPGARAGDDGECRGGPGRGHHRRGHPMRRVLQQLDLTDAQRAEIAEIRRLSRERGRALRESGDREAMHQHRRQTHERVRATLTDAQRARADELRREMEREHIDRRVTRMTEHLELSAAQQQQVRSILRGAAGQRRALHEQARLDGDSPREAMHQLSERTHAQIRAVLDAEQAARFDEVRRHRGPRHR